MFPKYVKNNHLLLKIVKKLQIQQNTVKKQSLTTLKCKKLQKIRQKC